MRPRTGDRRIIAGKVTPVWRVDAHIEGCVAVAVAVTGSRANALHSSGHDAAGLDQGQSPRLVDAGKRVAGMAGGGDAMVDLLRIPSHHAYRGSGGDRSGGHHRRGQPKAMQEGAVTAARQACLPTSPGRFWEHRGLSASVAPGRRAKALLGFSHAISSPRAWVPAFPSLPEDGQRGTIPVWLECGDRTDCPARGVTTPLGVRRGRRGRSRAGRWGRRRVGELNVEDGIQLDAVGGSLHRAAKAGPKTSH